MQKKTFFKKILKNKYVLSIIKILIISFLLFFSYNNNYISLEKGEFYNKITNKDLTSLQDKTGKKSVFSFLNENNGNERLLSLQNITGKLLISPNKNGYKVWEGQIQKTSKKDFFYGRLYQRTYKNSKRFIKKLGENGVDVKIILEDKKYAQYKNDFKNLQKYFGDSVELKNDHKLGVNYTHAKTFVSNNFTIIQTANLSHSSFVKNKEHFFWTKNKKIQKNVLKLWEKDWNGESISSKDINPNILFCPIDCREKIEYLLNKAKKSIFGYQQYITDKNIKKIIKTKKSDNVKIQLKLPDTKQNMLFKKELRNSVNLLKEPYIHSKTFLIDDKYLILGSMNMSSNSLDNNREIGIIITNKEIIKKWKKDFIK